MTINDQHDTLAMLGKKNRRTTNSFMHAPLGSISLGGYMFCIEWI